MTVYNLSVGGGRIRNVACGGAFYPQNYPTCCDLGGPDVAHDDNSNQYFRSLNFTGEKALACWCDENGDSIAAGDKFVLFPIHAGHLAKSLSWRNIHGCDGLKYHFEVIDLAALEANPAVAPELTFPSVDGSVSGDAWVDITALNGGDPYFGKVFGTVAGKPCAEHKVLALVLDSLPTSQDANSTVCVPCAQMKLGCGGNCKLACINVEVTVPVEVHGGLRTV